MMNTSVKPAHELARRTAQWAHIMTKWLVTYSHRQGATWNIAAFNGKGGCEARGIVDLIAIRKDHGSIKAGLKRGDLFELVLIQTKGGSAPRPTRQRICRAAITGGQASQRQGDCSCRVAAQQQAGYLPAEEEAMGTAIPPLLRPTMTLQPIPTRRISLFVKHILELFNSTRLTAQEAKDVLSHLQFLSNWGTCRTRQKESIANDASLHAETIVLMPCQRFETKTSAVLAESSEQYGSVHPSWLR